MNVQIVGEYFFVLYFYLLNFFVFSIDFACMCAGVCVLYRLVAGLLSVPVFPVVGFVLIWVGVSPLAICQSHCPYVQ